MNSEEIQRFKRFLVENKCYEEFCDNLHAKESFSDYCKKTGFESAVNCAFDWNKTNQGYYYWDNIMFKWFNYGKINTFEDACLELGSNHPFVEAYNLWITHKISDTQKDILAYMKLRIICAALNKDWKPQFAEDEKRWYPWFSLYTQEELDDMDNEQKENRHIIDVWQQFSKRYAGFGLNGTCNNTAEVIAGMDSSLCFPDKGLAKYCGKQFIELWKNFYIK